MGKSERSVILSSKITSLERLENSACDVLHPILRLSFTEDPEFLHELDLARPQTWHLVQIHRMRPGVHQDAPGLRQSRRSFEGRILNRLFVNDDAKRIHSSLRSDAGLQFTDSLGIHSGYAVFGRSLEFRHVLLISLLEESPLTKALDAFGGCSAAGDHLIHKVPSA